MQVRLSGLLQCVKDPSAAVSYGAGPRPSQDPALLWLWLRLAAVAPIGPLAWEIPYVKWGPKN